MPRNAPDDELDEAGRALVDSESHRVNVKLEENAWGASVVLKHTRVMGHAVLVRI